MALPTARAARPRPYRTDLTTPYTIRGLLHGYGWPNVGSVSLMVLAELASPALLALSGLLIVLASTGIPIMLLTVQIVSVRAMALLRASAGYFEDVITHDTAFRLLATLRVSVWTYLIPLVPGPSDTGKLLARVSRDIDDIRDALLAGLIPAIAVPVATVIVTIIAWIVDPVAGWIMTVGALLGLGGTTIAALAQPGIESTDRTALHAQIVDTLGGAEELRAYGAWDQAVTLVASTSHLAADRERRLAIRRGWATTVASLAGAFSTTAMGYALYQRSLDGLADPLTVAPMVLMSLGAFEVIGALGPAVQRIRLARQAIDHVNATLATPPIGLDDAPVNPAVTTIGVDGVTLAHTDLPPITFTLSQGEVLAIAGPSGIGKTSLLRALCGLNQRSGGRILADGEPVAHLREVIAVAGQDAHLMPTTIAGNVAIGLGPLKDAGDDQAITDRITQALTLAQVDQWVATLAEGIHTHVGIGYLTVSGGQQRRIALARALVSQRPFVALDEPTAGLDQATAQEFLDDALAVLGDRGVIIISHDEMVLSRADRVLWLGEPVAQRTGQTGR